MDDAGWKSPPDRCGNIRWKGMFVETEQDPTVPRSGDPLCWCVLTQNCLGPDGQVVDERACNRARSCYQE